MRKDSVGYGSLRARIGTKNEESKIESGLITSVDPVKNTMSVKLDGAEGPIFLNNIPIQNVVTNYGAGFRMMPNAGVSRAIMYKESEEKYIHLGYTNEDLERYMSDKLSEKEDGNDTPKPLRRYLEEGEVQVSSDIGGEVLLSKDGSVLSKNQYGANVRLDNNMCRMDGLFANLKYEMDDVRIRAGNVIRPVEQDTYADAFMIDIDDLPVADDALLPEEVGNLIKEFTVQVGTRIDSVTGADIGTPSVGTLSLASKVIEEDGSEMIRSGQNVLFALDTAIGTGLYITEDGSFYIMDKKTGNATKFAVGDEGVKSFRVGNNIMEVTTEGISLNHESGAALDITKDGQIMLMGADGRGVMLQDGIVTLSAGKGRVTIASDFVTMSAGDIKLGPTATEWLLPAQKFAVFFDTHFHAGPAGPPVPAPLGTLVAQVVSGAQRVSGIAVTY